MLGFIMVEILSLNKTGRCNNISNELIWDGHCYYTNTGRLFAFLAEAKRVKGTVPDDSVPAGESQGLSR